MLLLLAACNTGIRELPIDTVQATTVPESSTPTLSEESPSPSPVTTEDVPAERTQVILVAPSGADANLVENVQAMLADLAQADGLSFEARASISAADLTNEVRVVVILPPAPEGESPADLASTAPEIQFLGIGFPGAQPAGNLSLIRVDGSSPGQIGFLAGYLAAVITPEWRVGALVTSDDPAGLALREGFRNGIVFFCGLCRQTFPPYLTYPLYAELPVSASPEEWQTAALSLIDQSVQTAYVAPGAGDAEVLEMLAQAGVGLIGSQPPPAGLREQWVATLSVNVLLPLESLWPDLVAGQGGGDLTASLELTNVNPELLSPGRQLLVEEMIAELSAGLIDTGVQP